MRVSLNYKYFFFAFVLLSSASCSTVNPQQTDEEKERQLLLNYKIKTVTEYKTTFLLGMQQPELISSEKFYDDSALLIKDIYHKTDGAIDAAITNKYDKNGNLIEANGVNADSSFLYRETKTYDERGRRIEFYHYLGDGSYKYRNVAAYDPYDRMTELRWYWPDGLKSINKYTYNGRKKTADSEFDPHGNLRYTWAYSYDVHGNLIDATQFGPDHAVRKKTTYVYNQSNQLVRQINNPGEIEETYFTFEYDNRGFLSAKTEYSSKNRASAKLRYEYKTE